MYLLTHYIYFQFLSNYCYFSEVDRNHLSILNIFVCLFLFETIEK